MDSSVSPKDELCFLRVYHHISTGLYHLNRRVAEPQIRSNVDCQFNLLKPPGNFTYHQVLHSKILRAGLCICVFCMDLRTNSKFCLIHHLQIGSYNWGGECLQRGMDWVLIQHIYRVTIKKNRHFQSYVVSPDLTPCDFFLWGYIKDRVFVPPLPVSLNELKQRITTSVASVEDMLRSVWTELDYRIDICRVTKGSHIEHL